MKKNYFFFLSVLDEHEQKEGSKILLLNFKNVMKMVLIEDIIEY